MRWILGGHGQVCKAGHFLGQTAFLGLKRNLLRWATSLFWGKIANYCTVLVEKLLI